LQAERGVTLQGAQLVCLGTGDSNLENGLRWLKDMYHDQARGWVGFNVPFSHRLTAGADILLMPSRFEPCGLNQVYAMNYGTVPIAHATGGLKDTVITYSPGTPEGTTGWAFEGCTADGLKGALWQALTLYRCAATAQTGLACR
jgi:starch synthase